MGIEEHRRHAPRTVGFAVITASDTKDEEADGSGRLIRRSLEAAGHRCVYYRIVPDDADDIRRALGEASALEGVGAVLINGGTGISPRDRTYEAVSGLLEKRLDGFGELFRMLSFEEIGPAAILSRAVAGTYRGVLVFSMPGSPAAVRLAVEKLILPELGHFVHEVTRGRKEPAS